METKWAEENLQTIRTLMERSALYRRALAPTLIYCGVVGIAGGLIGSWLGLPDASSSLWIWVIVAVAAVLGAFFLMRRQALKDAEPIWSAPTRRVIQALFPPIFIGAFETIRTAFWSLDETGLIYSVAIWCWLYGCALCSAGFFMPRVIRSLGWQFIIAGCVLFGCLTNANMWKVFNGSFHLLMGGLFGGLHLAYGIYLYFTESRKTVA